MNARKYNTTNPLMNNADKTGIHPDVKTFLVYLFLSTT